MERREVEREGKERRGGGRREEGGEEEEGGGEGMEGDREIGRERGYLHAILKL